MIKISREALSELLVYAERYAMGRRSSAPARVARSIIAHRAALIPNDRETILRDYDEAKRRHELGDPCDETEWDAMALALRAQR